MTLMHGNKWDLHEITKFWNKKKERRKCLKWNEWNGGSPSLFTWVFSFYLLSLFRNNTHTLTHSHKPILSYSNIEVRCVGWLIRNDTICHIIVKNFWVFELHNADLTRKYWAKWNRQCGRLNKFDSFSTVHTLCAPDGLHLCIWRTRKPTGLCKRGWVRVRSLTLMGLLLWSEFGMH